jgi:uncharacterized protein (TIGR00730 family)
LKHICVFAGSSKGNREVYQQAAQALGQELVARGIGLVYGGGSVGLMGVIADAVLARGGEAIGVIPRALFPREIAHPNLTELHDVESMHERKSLMAELSDGFIALPGGFGTFDELFEMATRVQVGLHTKPVGLLNVENYFAPTLAQMDLALKEGFLVPQYALLLMHQEHPTDLLDELATFRPEAYQSKWGNASPEP